MREPPHEPIRILLYGAGGRMGHAVMATVSRFPGLRIEVAVLRSDHRMPFELPSIHPDRLASAPPFDVAIDFSLASAFDPLLDECVARGVALVSGTTGLSAAQRMAIDEAARRIPLLWASNFSPGMAVLARLSQLAAAALPDWDCEILELHHRHKRDAPSGSAITLADAVAAGRGDEAGWLMRGREGGRRGDGEIGIASQRGGDIVGEHTVSLYGVGERLDLVHRAHDRSVFAWGALLAAQRLAGQPAGQYALADLLLPSN